MSRRPITINGITLSDTMYCEIAYAGRMGYQGEMFYTNKRTLDALLRRGLITHEYDGSTFATYKSAGYQNPVLTVAAWRILEATGHGTRPADKGRMDFDAAWDDAHTCGQKLAKLSGAIVHCTKPKGHAHAHAA